MEIRQGGRPSPEQVAALARTESAVRGDSGNRTCLRAGLRALCGHEGGLRQAGGGIPRCPLRHQLPDELPACLAQLLVAALREIRESGVIETEQVQQGHMHVLNGMHDLDG